MNKHLIIGTRGSQLALAQTRLAIQAIQDKYPDVHCSIRTITTQGDLGKREQPGSFTNGVEEALIKGEVDVGVHSLKDLPYQISPDCHLPCVLPREDAREVLITHTDKNIFKDSLIIGTSSVRRKTALRALNPLLEVREIHGNVNDRIARYQGLGMDAILLAAAGVKRLNLQGHIRKTLDITHCVSAPGQGAIALEILSSNKAAEDILTNINDPSTALCTTIERYSLKRFGGVCNMPLGTYAEILSPEKIKIQMFYGMNTHGKINFIKGQIPVNQWQDHVDQMLDLLIENAALNE